MQEANTLTDMMRRTTVVFLLLLAALILGVYAYKEYQRKPADLSKATAAHFVDAKTLVAGYLLNEEEANIRYLGKIVEVNGLVVSSAQQNIIIGDAKATNNVSCTLDSARQTAIDLPTEGKQVTIRGICTGFLIDVELNRCVIVNE